MITWDEPKRLANLDKHGIDLADVDESFFLNAFVRPTKADRFQAIGRLAGRTVSIIFARLGSEGVAVISARPARKDERRLLR